MIQHQNQPSAFFLAATVAGIGLVRLAYALVAKVGTKFFFFLSNLTLVADKLFFLPLTSSRFLIALLIRFIMTKTTASRLPSNLLLSRARRRHLLLQQQERTNSTKALFVDGGG